MLNDLVIQRTKVEPVTELHKTPHLKQWTLYTVTISEGKAESVAEEVSKALEQEHEWYADFENDGTHYIIFRNRVCKVDRPKPEQYKPVAEHGLLLGIPDYELDFPPHIVEWKRQSPGMKRAFIIHGWDGYPEEGWFPWVKQELQDRGFTVEVPKMPHPDHPTIDDWVGHLATLVGEPDEQTHLIGHSMGCQTILRYLASLNDKKIGGVVLVAGFFELAPLETEDEKEIARPWLETPIDVQKVKRAARNIIVILSDNDEWVPLDRNKQLFERYLSPEIVVEHGKGHYSGRSGIKRLPAALQAVLRHAGT